VGVSEEPVGSNTGPFIDGWNAAAHVALGSFWCASFVADVYRSCGAALPPGPASCDSWMTWGKEKGAWRTTPSLGAAVLYGVPGDAKHIGIIIRVSPQVFSVEGNTTVEGAKFERNGTAVAMKIVDPKTDPVLGYVMPMLAAGPAPIV
jgi:hypothetical protein